MMKIVVAILLLILLLAAALYGLRLAGVIKVNSIDRSSMKFELVPGLPDRQNWRITARDGQSVEVRVGSHMTKSYDGFNSEWEFTDTKVHLGIFCESEHGIFASYDEFGADIAQDHTVAPQTIQTDNSDQQEYPELTVSTWSGMRPERKQGYVDPIHQLTVFAKAYSTIKCP